MNQSKAQEMAEQMESGKWRGMFDLLAAYELRRLDALNAELIEALHRVSLASQNSMSSQRECGVIARKALAKALAKEKENE